MARSAAAAKRHTAAKGVPAKLRLDDFIPYRMAVVAREMSAALAQKYAHSFGISIPEWRVMAHLAEVNVCSSGEICARTAMDKAKVNRAVTRLVASGLVLAETSKNDRRLNVLVLSGKGRGIYRRIAPIALEVEAAVTQSLTAPERSALLKILGKLQTTLNAHAQNRARST
jgi:DNA-binding MarR family transcriptional regulator